MNKWGILLAMIADHEGLLSIHLANHDDDMISYELDCLELLEYIKYLAVSGSIDLDC